MGKRLILLCMVCCALTLTFLPSLAWADEQQSVSPEVQENPTDGQDHPEGEEGEGAEEEEEPPPPRTFLVFYEANGGAGAMEPTIFTEGQPAPLDACTFTRQGYTFEGWTTQPDGGGTHYAERADLSSLFTADAPFDSITLYAQWGSQIYVIRYVSGVSSEHPFPVTGSVSSQLAVHDAEVVLRPCGFERMGYTATGWMDSNGIFHEFEERGINFSEETKTSSWKLAEISLDQVRPDPSPNWTCQGTVVFRNSEGATCAAVAYILFTDGYGAGSLDDYDSEIMVVNLDTGELITHASGLMLEHANDLTYCTANRHFYVAMGGLFEHYPDGIVELDEDLNVVRTITPEGTHNIWNITYSDGVFYAIGNVSGDSFARANPLGEQSDLIRLDLNLNVLDMHAIDYSPQGFTGQGMVCDGSYLYSIIYSPKEHESGSKQRLVTFTLDGEARGNQYLDMPGEVESGSSLDDHLYFSINQRTGTTIFGTDLAGTTMTTVWKPNAYQVTFDDNGYHAYDMPATIDTEYDSPFTLPRVEPKSPAYVFVEWNTKPDGSGQSCQPGQTLINLIESGTITFYAQWRRADVALVADNGVHARRFQRVRPNPNTPQTKPATQARGQGALDNTHKGVQHAAAVLVALLHMATHAQTAHARERKSQRGLPIGLFGRGCPTNETMRFA